MFNKMILVLTLGLISMAALAQMDEDKRQSMINAAEQMRSCFERVNEQELQQLQSRAATIESEVRELCQAGQHTHARSVVVQYSQELNNSPAIKQLRECGEMGEALIPETPDFADPQQLDNGDVCDHF